MVKNINELLEEIERLNKENAAFQQQLRETKESIDAIRTGSIDALVIADKKNLKVLTEATADKTYRILIEKMHEGAVILNEEGTILYCNSYFANMVNLPLQKVTGTKFKKFIDETSKERIEDLLKQGVENVLKEEVYIHVDDGRKLPVLMTANTFTLNNIFVLSIILTDLTIQNENQEELKRKTRQLEQNNIELENANKELAFQSEEKEKRAAELLIVNKELESFTYISSHDLQEPLRKIQIYSDRILEKEHAVLSDKGQADFQRIQDGARRMQALIEDLLAYSHSSITEPIFENTDLNSILGEVKNELAEAIREKNAIIEVHYLGEANINASQFRQVMHNLIGNSLKFSKPGIPPHIIIKSKIVEGSHFKNEIPSLKKKYCHISITDNGIGFEPKYKDQIFKVFQRLHRKGVYEGTGIGLAIVKKVVENHNGIITVSSEINKGTTFDIYIPA